MKPTEALDLQAYFKTKCQENNWKTIIRSHIGLSIGASYIYKEVADRTKNKEDQARIEQYEKVIDVYMNDIVRAGTSADCFFVREEMSDLIVFASSKLDNTDLFDPSLAPVDKGFAYFEKPLEVIDINNKKLLINLFLWENIYEDGKIQTTISCWNDASRTPDEYAVMVKESEERVNPDILTMHGRFHWIKSQTIMGGELIGGELIEPSQRELDNLKNTKLKKDENDEWIPYSDADWEEFMSENYRNSTNIKRLFHTFWLIMSQTITEKAKDSGDRAQRRRLEKANVPSEVIIVQFRKRRYASEDKSEEQQKVDWSHRWIVGGHWRWQPYKDPKSGGEIKKRIWISPYVKGPEDKPLVAKSKVFVLAK